MTLCAQEVSVRRGGAILLDGVCAEIAPGEVVAVVGPNGAGKSTLVNLLAGDIAPGTGRVILNQEDIANIPLARRAALRAVVGPPPRIAFDFTVADVVGMSWLGGAGNARDRSQAALAEVLRTCDLAHMAQRTFMSLSSGERQRAEFARGLLQLWCPVGDTAPRWLLLDEPSANLDVAHARAMLEQLRRIASRNIGVLAVLHDLDLAARCADRVILLEAGRVVVQGAPEAVMREEILSRVYRTPIHVEQHTLLNRLVVIT